MGRKILPYLFLVILGFGSQPVLAMHHPGEMPGVSKSEMGQIEGVAGHMTATDCMSLHCPSCLENAGSKDSSGKCGLCVEPVFPNSLPILPANRVVEEGPLVGVVSDTIVAGGIHGFGSDPPFDDIGIPRPDVSIRVLRL